MSTEEKKLHVDEDWKGQAQAEKEAAERARAEAAAAAKPTATGPAEAPPAEPPAESHPSAGTPDAESEVDRHAPLPPATLSVLISTLATQAFMAMGGFPHPATGKPEVHLDEAKHFIDLLTMLEQKTHGNRTPDEIALLSRILHEVRLAFVEATKRASADKT